MLRHLYAEVRKQHVSIIRHFLPHTNSMLCRHFTPFDHIEMIGFVPTNTSPLRKVRVPSAT